MFKETLHQNILKKRWEILGIRHKLIELQSTDQIPELASNFLN